MKHCTTHLFLFHLACLFATALSSTTTTEAPSATPAPGDVIADYEVESLNCGTAPDSLPGCSDRKLTVTPLEPTGPEEFPLHYTLVLVGVGVILAVMMVFVVIIYCKQRQQGYEPMPAQYAQPTVQSRQRKIIGVNLIQQQGEPVTAL
jgi:hypothetical protein